MQLVVPMNGLTTRRKAGVKTRHKAGVEAVPAEPTDVELLTEIRDLLAGRDKAH